MNNNILEEIERHLQDEYLFGQKNFDFAWHPDNLKPGKRFITFHKDMRISFDTGDGYILHGNKRFVSDILELETRYEHTILFYQDEPVSAYYEMVIRIDDLDIYVMCSYNRGDDGEGPEERQLTREFIPLAQIRQDKIDDILKK